MTSETRVFREHYQGIEAVAQKLKEGIEVHDIDELIPLQQQVITHYEHAKERLNSIAAMKNQLDALANTSNN